MNSGHPEDDNRNSSLEFDTPTSFPGSLFSASFVVEEAEKRDPGVDAHPDNRYDIPKFKSFSISHHLTVFVI